MDTRSPFLAGPLGATESSDQDPAVVMQLSNARGDRWSTTFAGAQKNTPEIDRAAQ